MTDKRVIVVIGVARSGTSCVSGMLSALGVDFDDGELLEPTEFNPRGYFESQMLNGLLDKQIQSVGGQRCQGERHKLLIPVRAYLDLELHRSHKPTGFKDTRLVSCGVPVVAYLKACGYDVRVVTTRRATAANQASLESWHKPDAARALSSLLTTHLQKTTKSIRRLGVPVLQVSYEQVLRDPTRQAWRLARFVGAPGYLVPGAVQFVDPALNHHSKEKAA